MLQLNTFGDRGSCNEHGYTLVLYVSHPSEEKNGEVCLQWMEGINRVARDNGNEVTMRNKEDENSKCRGKQEREKENIMNRQMLSLLLHNFCTYSYFQIFTFGHNEWEGKCHYDIVYTRHNIVVHVIPSPFSIKYKLITFSFSAFNKC